MDAMVTARVPVEIKEQGAAILKEMGSSITELVNAAFSYLLVERKLPSSDQPLQGVRKLSASQLHELESFYAQSSSEAPATFWRSVGDRSYEDMLSDWRARDYEALA